MALLRGGINHTPLSSLTFVYRFFTFSAHKHTSQGVYIPRQQRSHSGPRVQQQSPTLNPCKQLNQKLVVLELLRCAFNASQRGRVSDFLPSRQGSSLRHTPPHTRRQRRGQNVARLK
ncbi:hypothetical protein GOODEAATRI_015228 [Goodea atripinnis]|uniref:Uncharacterized protein n=1 Tax=Goodea atripinnis TaxID=208336 RepID=A0ABV0N1N5_9TELE